jgi:hypothetical protein
MTAKAQAGVLVRVLGLVALFKAALACVSLAVLVSGAMLAPTRPSGRVLAVQGLGVVLGFLVPALAALVCLLHTRPLAELVARGTGERPEPAPREDPTGGAESA